MCERDLLVHVRETLESLQESVCVCVCISTVVVADGVSKSRERERNKKWTIKRVESYISIARCVCLCVCVTGYIRDTDNQKGDQVTTSCEKRRRHVREKAEIDRI